MAGRDASNARQRPGAGVYRDRAHTTTTVIYNDNILVGNSYEAVHTQ